jgi:radical SAM superfamily enzyme YgiQ (UPF0313 family)
VDIAQFSILTPLPGTKLYKRLTEEKRIISHDWNKYGIFNCVFRPISWGPLELENALKESYRRFYSPTAIIKRINFRASIIAVFATIITGLQLRKLGR